MAAPVERAIRVWIFNRPGTICWIRNSRNARYATSAYTARTAISSSLGKRHADETLLTVRSLLHGPRGAGSPAGGCSHAGAGGACARRKYRQLQHHAIVRDWLSLEPGGR